MYRNSHDQYLEHEVMSSDPVKLVRILYRAAIDAVSAARARLREGDIRERSRQITRALRLLHELLRSLDTASGGEIARSLSRLYVYMTERLVEANAKQADAPLEEVERLLQTLLDGWSSITPAPPLEDEDLEPVSCSY